jgi:hypothetical protein
VIQYVCKLLFSVSLDVASIETFTKNASMDSLCIAGAAWTTLLDVRGMSVYSGMIQHK